MIEINKCKLVPGASTYWGFIAGNIDDQKDLVEYISTHGGGGGAAAWGSISGNISDQTDLMNLVSSFATESWVLSQGYLTSETIPSDIATQSWVESQGYLTSVPEGYATEQFVTDSLSGYATESWVESHGYLSEVPSGYATESWVESQGYLTSHQDLTGYATESWVSSQGYLTEVPSGYATESWVSSQGYLTEVPSEYATQSWVISQSYYQNDGTLDPLINREQSEGGYLKYNCILRGNALNWKTFSAAPSQVQAGKFVYNLNGEIYGFQPSTGTMYIWDQKTGEFVFYANTSGHNGEQYPLWNDNDGNVFFGNAYTVDLYMKEDGTQVTFTPHSMGGTYQAQQWSKHNICRRGGNIYMIVRDTLADDGTGTAYVYNPLTMEFDSAMDCTGIPENGWYTHTNDYENTTFYTKNGSQYYPEEYYDKNLDVITSIFFVDCTSNPTFPTSFTYNDNSYNIDGTRCIQYTNNVFFYIENSTKILFKYDWANQSLGWVPYGDSTNLLPFYIESGITVRDYGLFDNGNGIMFGFCSKSGKTGQIGVWNLGQTEEEYGWDNTVDSRLDAIESSLDSALSITNEILS